VNVTEIDNQESLQSNEQNQNLSSNFKNESGNTIPKPFRLSTSTRGDIYQAEFQNRIDKEHAEEDAQRVVKATKMRNPDLSFHPNKSTKEVTVPHEFNLESSMRHEIYQDTFEKKVLDMEDQENDKMNYKAMPLPSTTFQEKFEIVHPNRSPLRMISPNLHTQKRDGKTLSKIEETRDR